MPQELQNSSLKVKYTNSNNGVKSGIAVYLAEILIQTNNACLFKAQFYVFMLLGR